MRGDMEVFLLGGDDPYSRSRETPVSAPLPKPTIIPKVVRDEPPMRVADEAAGPELVEPERLRAVFWRNFTAGVYKTRWIAGVGIVVVLFAWMISSIPPEVHRHYAGPIVAFYDTNAPWQEYICDEYSTRMVQYTDSDGDTHYRTETYCSKHHYKPHDKYTNHFALNISATGNNSDPPVIERTFLVGEPRRPWNIGDYVEFNETTGGLVGQRIDWLTVNGVKQ